MKNEIISFLGGIVTAFLCLIAWRIRDYIYNHGKPADSAGDKLDDASKRTGEIEDTIREVTDRLKDSSARVEDSLSLIKKIREEQKN